MPRDGVQCDGAWPGLQQQLFCRPEDEPFDRCVLSLAALFDTHISLT